MGVLQDTITPITSLQSWEKKMLSYDMFLKKKEIYHLNSSSLITEAFILLKNGY